MTTATETKQEEVTFIAFLHDQRVVVVPRRPIYERDVSGAVIGVHTTEGKDAQFEDRRFTTDDPEIIEALRNHSYFNTPRGWQEDFDANRPSAEELQGAVSEAAAGGDVERLREIVVAEESSGDGGREAVLGSALKALAKLKEIEELATGAEAPVNEGDANNSAEAGSDVTEDPEDGNSA